MKEHNRGRLAELMRRHRRRLDRSEREADVVAEFHVLASDILAPLMEEIANELRDAGCAPRIELDADARFPSLSLYLGLPGGAGRVDRVAFEVIRRPPRPLEVLAFLKVTAPPFDIDRWTRPSEISPARAEQLLMDAVEHLIATA